MSHVSYVVNHRLKNLTFLQDQAHCAYEFLYL